MVTGPDSNLYYDYIKDDYQNINKYLELYDVFQDDPWYTIFEYLEGSKYDFKFIYLNREKNSWLRSIQRFYGEHRYNISIRRHFYGHSNTLENPDLYLNKYAQHEERVKTFFKNRENFISIDVRNASDTLRLQQFLNLPARYSEFPWAYKTPVTTAERKRKKTNDFIKGYFGLNGLVKPHLKRLLGRAKYIQLRTWIRHNRARFKSWKTKTGFYLKI